MCWADANASHDMWNVASSLSVRQECSVNSFDITNNSSLQFSLFLLVMPLLSAEFLVFVIV